MPERLASSSYRSTASGQRDAERLSMGNGYQNLTFSLRARRLEGGPRAGLRLRGFWSTKLPFSKNPIGWRGFSIRSMGCSLFIHNEGMGAASLGVIVVHRAIFSARVKNSCAVNRSICEIASEKSLAAAKSLGNVHRQAPTTLCDRNALWLTTVQPVGCTITHDSR